MAASSDEVPIYDFAGRESAGLLVRADTIAELEERLGPAGATRSSRPSTTTTPRSADGSPDALGRRAPVRRASASRFPLEQAPFYAHPSGSVVLATYCGLTVDTRAAGAGRLRRADRRLYAAGEVIGGFHGAGYMTGHLDRQGRHLRPPRRHRTPRPRRVSSSGESLRPHRRGRPRRRRRRGRARRAGRPRPGRARRHRGRRRPRRATGPPSSRVDVTDEASVAGPGRRRCWRSTGASTCSSTRPA